VLMSCVTTSGLLAPPSVNFFPFRLLLRSFAEPSILSSISLTAGMSYPSYNNNGQNQGHYQSQETYYDPYAPAAASQHEPHPSYDQAGYHDDYYQDNARPVPVANFPTQELDQPFSAEKVNAPLRDKYVCAHRSCSFTR
jgi:hypothetical protein